MNFISYEKDYKKSDLFIIEQKSKNFLKVKSH
jgi:hypothetical protein